MAKKGKIKISKVKHSNQVITKLKKQGKLKNQRHKKRKVVQRQPSKIQQHAKNEEYSDNESLQGSDLMDMMEEEDLNYLMKNSGKTDSLKKRDVSNEENDEDLERILENNRESDLKHIRKKQLLPIKTKSGFVMREVDVEDKNIPSDHDEQDVEIDTAELTQQETDNEKEIGKIDELIIDKKKPVSTADILIARHDELQRKKMKIGLLCSTIIETPENKIDNLFGLLNFMDEKTKSGHENLLTIRKLATVSILEVFKDILPDYHITQHNFDGAKLKKDTLLLQKYENSLLAHYKRYLQRLEKMSSVLVKKKGDAGKNDATKIKLGHISITCLCDLLVSHSYFNFSPNIAQMLVPFLNNRNPNIRIIVNECFKTVFKFDKKGLISLTIVRRINHLVKKCSNDVNSEVLNCLLALRIKDINLDSEKLVEMKQKKQISHKQRLLSMSKKERKRNKKLKQLEKEMLETKAEENIQTKKQNLTEIVKVIFTIYFRVLKRSPCSKILSASLEGLSTFAHVMNLEFFSDLVNLLDKLLENEDLGYREQLHCVDTVFTILSGQGEVLNIDPSRFYAHFYRNLLKIHAGKNHKDLIIILKTISNVLIKRRKKVSLQVLLALMKRITTLSTQVLHNGTLALMGVIKTVMQQFTQSQTLLELDHELGSGHYDPLLMEPEYCNASSTALYELPLLGKHYHPVVRAMAVYIMNGVPVTGEGSLSTDVSKLSPEQLFNSYDGCQMSFKPSIPIPKKTQSKLKLGLLTFTHPSFEEYCMETANKQIKGPFDFLSNFNKEKIQM